MSKENVISKKEPFARMVKRDHISVGKAWAIRLIAVALSLVVAVQTMIFSVTNPTDFVDWFETIHKMWSCSF